MTKTYKTIFIILFINTAIWGFFQTSKSQIKELTLANGFDFAIPDAPAFKLIEYFG